MAFTGFGLAARLWDLAFAAFSRRDDRTSLARVARVARVEFPRITLTGICDAEDAPEENACGLSFFFLPVLVGRVDGLVVLRGRDALGADVRVLVALDPPPELLGGETASLPVLVWPAVDPPLGMAAALPPKNRKVSRSLGNWPGLISARSIGRSALPPVGPDPPSWLSPSWLLPLSWSPPPP